MATQDVLPEKQITELKAALQKCEARFQRFVGQTKDLITQVNREGQLTYVNHAAEGVFGLPPADCVGRSAFEFIHPDDKERTTQAFAEWLEHRLTNATIENRQVNQVTGDVRHMLWTVNLQYAEDGQLLEINSIARDITRRMQTEQVTRRLYKISQQLNTASDEQELLQVLAQHAIEKNVFRVTLSYIEIDQEANPQWIETVAEWVADKTIPRSIGMRFHLSEYPFSQLLLKHPDQVHFVADVAVDDSLDESTRDLFMQLGIQAIVIVPLRQGNRWVGVFAYAWQEPHRFDEGNIEIYNALPALVAPELANRRLLRAQEAARHQSELLYQISLGLNRARDEDELLEVLAQPAINSGACFAELNYIDVDEVGDPAWITSVAYWQSEGPEFVNLGQRDPLPDYPFLRLMLKNPDKPFITSDIMAEDDISPEFKAMVAPLKMHAMVHIGLKQAERWVGMVSFVWSETHTFGPQELALYNTLPVLAAPAVASRQLVNNLERMVQDRTAALEESEETYKLALGATNDGLWDWDMVTDAIRFSDRYYTMLGYEPGDFPEAFSSWEALVHPDDLPHSQQDIANYISGKTPNFRTEFRAHTKDGQWCWILGRGEIVSRDAEGNPTRMMGTHTDITAQKQAAAERERLQQDIIDAQRETLKELSTPIIPVMDAPDGSGGIIVMPLIGNIDTMRAQDLMRSLLAGISEHRAKYVILDVTGVPLMDTGIVNHINKTIQAARLKGAYTIVTGISDAVAEAIVDLGIDWDAVDTLSDLRTGLLFAFNKMGLRVHKTK